MDVYLGALGLSLALIGAGAWRDRWVGFWVALAALGAVMMLGRYTFLFDRMNRVPVLGSARIPVRYHLWVTLGVAALASVGVDRLSRPGKVRIRGAAWGMLILALVALAIALNAYAPAWDGPGRWTSPYARTRNRRLADELTWAVVRSAALAILGWLAIVVGVAVGTDGDPARARRVVAAARPGRAPGRPLARRADGVAGLLDQAPGERRGDQVRPRTGADRRVRRPDGECAGVRRDADRFLQGARRPGLESRAGLGPAFGDRRDPDLPAPAARVLQRGAVRERAQRRRGGDACPHGRGDLPRPGPPPARGLGADLPQPARAAEGAAHGPPGLRRRRAPRRPARRRARRRGPSASGRGGPRSPLAGRRGRLGHGQDRRRRARAGRGRDRVDGPRLSRAGRHLRPRLVGHRSTASRRRSGRRSSPSAPSTCRRAGIRSSSATAPRVSSPA